MNIFVEFLKFERDKFTFVSLFFNAFACTNSDRRCLWKERWFRMFLGVRDPAGGQQAKDQNRSCLRGMHG